MKTRCNITKDSRVEELKIFSRDCTGIFNSFRPLLRAVAWNNGRCTGSEKAEAWRPDWWQGSYCSNEGRGPTTDSSTSHSVLAPYWWRNNAFLNRETEQQDSRSYSLLHLRLLPWTQPLDAVRSVSFSFTAKPGQISTRKHSLLWVRPVSQDKCCSLFFTSSSLFMIHIHPSISYSSTTSTPNTLKDNFLTALNSR